MPFNPYAYGPVLSPLVDSPRDRPLDAGSPAAEMRGSLRDLTVAAAFAHGEVTRGEMALCCLSGIWLLYDFLDESHEISQGVRNSSGSFWHGIMHRREGDFSNAKYWFRQVGPHPIFPELAAAAQELAAADDSAAAESLQGVAEWDPLRFVDLCQAAVQGRSGAGGLLRRVQQAEWELLFDFCYRRALASQPT